MGLFDFLKHADINKGLEDYRNSPNALLLDVRSPEEYREGHIPGSVNLPLPNLHELAETENSPEKPLFVYCHSGARSRQAAKILRMMGYTKVTDLGGILSYKGRIET